MKKLTVFALAFILALGSFFAGGSYSVASAKATKTTDKPTKILVFSSMVGNTSAFTGALILIWADVLARVLLASGQELPVGVVTALLGGPFFFYLLKSRRARGMW